jgi:hypothetical protein
LCFSNPLLCYPFEIVKTCIEELPVNPMNRLTVVFVFFIALCVTACSDDNPSSPAPATDTEDDGSLGGSSGADADDDSNGGNKEGGAEEGGAEEGGAEEGGAEDGGVEDGGVEDGGVEDGGVEDGSGGCEEGCETAEGTCVDEGTVNPGEPCEICSSGYWTYTYDDEACDGSEDPVASSLFLSTDENVGAGCEAVQGFCMDNAVDAQACNGGTVVSGECLGGADIVCCAMEPCADKYLTEGICMGDASMGSEGAMVCDGTLVAGGCPNTTEEGGLVGCCIPAAE